MITATRHCAFTATFKTTLLLACNLEYPAAGEGADEGR